MSRRESWPAAFSLAAASRLGRGMQGAGGGEGEVASASCLAAGGAEDEPRSQQHLLFGWPGESLMESTR